MRRPAKLEAQIADLAAEVQEMARKRGRALPTTGDWVDLVVALGVTWEEMEATPQSGESDTVIFSRLTRREVTPAAEPLIEAVLAVEAAALAQARPAYYRALCELRSPLANLLVQRAEAWSQPWQDASEFLVAYREAKQWLKGAAPPTPLAGLDPSSAEKIRGKIAQTKGWPLVLLAGTALQCAAAERAAWCAWIAGGETAPHDPGLPEEEEAELVRRGVVRAEALAAAKARPPATTESPPNLRYPTKRDPGITLD